MLKTLKLSLKNVLLFKDNTHLNIQNNSSVKVIPTRRQS